MAKKTYSKPDNLTADDLKVRLLKTAEERLQKNCTDKWALEVKGRLMGISDLVAEETLLHKRCNTNFLNGRSNNKDGEIGRKIDEDRQTLFEALCKWLEKRNGGLFIYARRSPPRDVPS